MWKHDIYQLGKKIKIHQTSFNRNYFIHTFTPMYSQIIEDSKYGKSMNSSSKNVLVLFQVLQFSVSTLSYDTSEQMTTMKSINDHHLLSSRDSKSGEQTILCLTFPNTVISPVRPSVSTETSSWNKWKRQTHGVEFSFSSSIIWNNGV